MLSMQGCPFKHSGPTGPVQFAVRELPTSVSSRSTFSRVAACMVASKCASLSCFCSARICCSIWSPARSRWLMCCCSCCTSCASGKQCCYALSFAGHMLMALPVLLHLLRRAAARLSDGKAQYSSSAEAALSWWQAADCTGLQIVRHCHRRAMTGMHEIVAAQRQRRQAVAFMGATAAMPPVQSGCNPWSQPQTAQCKVSVKEVQRPSKGCLSA